ncbi:hypothetical protein [Roseimaritima ulvae]|uniref:Uncharacterized protein n=1 Tax=Roseimaritima ulvae TaxID=980254 RepID=A0A5B9QZL6_9BACT|nr:hypothetical protein [Roseimaritima ulvae]QEG42626.1 hypothetical protein UC8_46680 [Roseimaritima ulvae]
MTASPGTLIWIGSRTGGETRDAFAYCQQHAAQLAVRESLQDAVERPADAVSGILISRQSRHSVDADHVEALAQQYPTARRTVLIGSNAEGEGRTGLAWPGWQRVAWHAWNQVLPDWFSPAPPLEPAAVADALQPVGLTLVVAATLSHAEALLDTLEQWSVAALWQRQPSPTTARHIHRVIWDDSAAPATTAALWQQRLQSVHLADDARHAWTVHYPRVEQLTAARRGGVDVTISKPYLQASLFRFLSPATPCS